MKSFVWILFCALLLLNLSACSGAGSNLELAAASQTDLTGSRGASAVVGQPGGGNNGCLPTVGATFNCTAVTATSTKDLSNVVLLFCDGKHQKFEGLNGNSRTFSGTGDNSGKVIKGVWIKSGCNSSGDGPGYGTFIANGASACEDCGCPPPPPVDCPPPPVVDCPPPPVVDCPPPPVVDCPPAPPADCPPAPCKTCPDSKNKNDGKDSCCDGNAGKGNDWKCSVCQRPACGSCQGSKNKNDGKDNCCDGNAGKGNDWKCTVCGRQGKKRR